jgi:hypothetical protein
VVNKSLLTNGTAATVAVAGMTIPGCPEAILSMGLFGLSGGVTNWLAIHMLFEKVPCLYGSGVIPHRFEDFKAGIRRLILEQFFTRDNLAAFFADRTGTVKIDPEQAAEAVDPEALFLSLKEGVKASPLGGMLAMVGGDEALEPLREPFKEKVRDRLKEIFAGDRFQALAGKLLAGGGGEEQTLGAIEVLIDRRLAELTPTMVKEIIQEMIRRHLGWLVVWGGVFGGLIGLVAGLLQY